VDPGWVSNDQFLAGYGAAQAVPGPLFTFSAYLGALSGPSPNGLTGATIALIAIFLPSFLLIFAALPFWDRLRGWTGFRRALSGTNAAVVGTLAAALSPRSGRARSRVRSTWGSRPSRWGCC